MREEYKCNLFFVNRLLLRYFEEEARVCRSPGSDGRGENNVD